MTNAKLTSDYLSFNNITKTNVVVKQTASTNNVLEYSTTTLTTRTGMSKVNAKTVIFDNQNNIYIAGGYVNNSTTTPIYNMSGLLSTIQLPISSSASFPDNFIIKYNSAGIANSWTIFSVGNQTLNNEKYKFSTVLNDDSGNIYWIGNYTTAVTTIPILNFSTSSVTTSSYSMVQPVNSLPYIYIIKYNSSGTVIAYSFLDTYIGFYGAYWYSDNLYICGSAFANINVRNIGLGTGTVGSISINGTNGYIIKYYNDNFDSSSTMSNSYTPVSVIANNNYICVAGYYSASTVVYSFNSGSTINSPSLTLPAPSIRGIGLLKYNINGLINSYSHIPVLFATNAYLLNIGSTLCVSGIYSSSVTTYLNNFTTNGVNATSSGLSLPNSGSQYWNYIIKYNSDGSVNSASSINGTVNLDWSNNMCFDVKNNYLYLSGGYTTQSSFSIVNFYTSTSTSSTLSLPTISTGNSSFIIKYDSNGIATSYTVTENAKYPFIYNDNLGSIYSVGFYTSPILISDFTTSGTGTVRYTYGPTSVTSSSFSKWTSDGLVDYVSRVSLKTIQEPIDTYDVANKKYADGSFEYLSVSGQLASLNPNVTSVLKPPELTPSDSISPLMYNSSPTNVVIDGLGFVYVASSYTGYIPSINNKDGSSNLEVLSSLGSSFAISKYSSTGTLVGQTVLIFNQTGSLLELTTDASNNIYASGSYSSDTTVNIYDFSASSVPGLCRAVLPIGSYNFVIRWSSDGVFNLCSPNQSYASLNSVAIDSTGSIYSPINSIVSNVSNFIGNSVVTPSQYSLSIGTIAAFSQNGAKLVGSGNTGAATQGRSVSIYKDTMAVGGYTDNTNQGAVWIFVRGTNGSWSQQGSKLIGTGNTGAARQGISVSVYEDTMAVGGYTDNSSVGAVWVFQRSGSSWTQVQKLIGTGNTGASQQGYAVSLYKNTIAFSGYTDNSSQGAAWIFQRSQTSNTWSQQGSKLVGSGNTGAANQGLGISLYEDTVAVGGPIDNTSQGATWIFKRATGGTWSQEGSKLIGTGGTTFPGQGYGISVYRDTVAVGGALDNSDRGATWIFTRATGGTWSQQGPKLIGSSPPASAQQGFSVSLYEDTLVVGCTVSGGGVWIFNRVNNVWTQQGQKLIGVGQTGSASFGIWASLYKNTLAIGAHLDNTSQGSAYIYENKTTGLTKWNNQGTVTNFVPIQNFVTSDIKLDSLNNIYCVGSVYNCNSSSMIYNLNNNQTAFTLSQTSGGLAIIKWEVTGVAQGYSFLGSSGGSFSGPVMSIDSQNNLYCSGSYTSSVVVPVYNFSNGIGTNTISPFSLPIATTQSTYIIKWSSDGVPSTYTLLQGPTGSNVGSNSGAVLSLCNDKNGSIYLATSYDSTSTVQVNNFYSGQNTGTTVTTFSLPSTGTGTWTTTGSMNLARNRFSQTKLLDGRVLVIGGVTTASTSNSATTLCEVYDPILKIWTTTGSLSAAVFNSASTLLQNGSVLLVGGQDSGAGIVNTCVLYNPVTGSWTTTGSTNIARLLPCINTLYNGSVLVSGGFGFSSCELYNPSTGLWTTTGSMSSIRYSFNTKQLGSGSILAIGGFVSSSSTNTCEIYNPSTGVWTTTGSMQYNCYSAISNILQNGNILTIGGISGSSTGSYIYDSPRALWLNNISAPTSASLSYTYSTILPNGQVFLCGGSTSSAISGISNSYLYNPVYNTWITTGSMNVARLNNNNIPDYTTLLNDGAVLVVGGSTGTGLPIAAAELYTPRGSKTALIKWTPDGVASRYQILNNSLSSSTEPIGSCLAIDNTGSINYIGASGSNVTCYNMFTGSSTSSAISRLIVNPNNALNSIVPISKVYNKWTGNGSVNLDPYSQDFFTSLANPTEPMTKKIVNDTNNYNYKILTDNKVFSNISQLTWDGSKWT